LGISKSATDSTDNNNENYGIIPYMAPEILQRQNYTKASDIYSFGMIMWEFMTGRRPFWDRIHEIELIIEICDGLRPPIVTNAPEGYIELMQRCWHPDPKKGPTASDISNIIEWGGEMYGDECNNSAVISDLGLSKPELLNDSNEVYGIIPYVAPEIFKEKKYTKASDIYSFGMIMWELMTGRKPFWDQNHNTELIIEICDGLRPPIITNAPDGYIELMQKCWHSDPNERPTANDILDVIYNKLDYYKEKINPTKIIRSPDIGPITNNPDAIYKSRPLSTMIKSANITKSLKIQSINSESGT